MNSIHYKVKLASILLLLSQQMKISNSLTGNLDQTHKNCTSIAAGMDTHRGGGATQRMRGPILAMECEK